MADSFYVSGLFSAFNELMDANDIVKSNLRKSLGPFYLPQLDNEDKNPREFIADSLTSIWLSNDFQRTPVVSGILCAERDLLDSVVNLNKCKDNFRAAVMRARGENKSKHKFKFESHLRADPEFREILRGYRLSNIDLEACYTHIRILPKSLSAVRWTWAMKAHGVEKIMVSDLIKRLEENESPMKDIILERLIYMKATDFIVEKVPKRPQLKVNVGFYDESGYVNFPFSCSGIMLSQDKDLPPKERILWRNPEEVKQKPSRGESIICDEPFIKFTNFYQYKPGKMPTE